MKHFRFLLPFSKKVFDSDTLKERDQHQFDLLIFGYYYDNGRYDAEIHRNIDDYPRSAITNITDIFLFALGVDSIEDYPYIHDAILDHNKEQESLLETFGNALNPNL